MAKKSGNLKRQGQRSELPTQSLRGQRRGAGAGAGTFEGREYKDILREFVSSPAVKYVAGGIASAFLARLASNISELAQRLCVRNLPHEYRKLGPIESLGKREQIQQKLLEGLRTASAIC